MKGNFILTSRLSLGFTQEELAEKLNSEGIKCSKQAVCNWEKNIRNPQTIVINLLKRWINEKENEND